MSARLLAALSLLGALGEVIKLGRKIAFVEGTLYNEAGDILARMSSSGVPIPMVMDPPE